MSILSKPTPKRPINFKLDAFSNISLLKNVPLMHQETSLGNWPRTSISSRELNGKIFGLMGFGLIAKKVSTLAKIFNAHIIAYDPFIDLSIANEFNIKLVDINEIFENADVISIHLPLTPTTKNLLNYDAFTKMKKQPIIINPSRGINNNWFLFHFGKSIII